MRIVIAPDSFKGSLASQDVARVVARAWADVRPDDTVVTVPMADGGEGTLAAFAAAETGAVQHPIEVRGPDDRPVHASWLEFVDVAGTRTAMVELASTSGITLLDRPAPLDAHTVGFGQAIRTAIDAGCDRVVVAIGASASSDGGMGVLASLGARFLDSTGRPVQLGNRGLHYLREIDVSGLIPLPAGGVVVLTDVTSPLLGPEGAIAVFGPQKGLTDETAPAAEADLASYAALLAGVLPARVDQPGAGAAGGTGFGLSAWGAELAAGAVAVGELVGLGDLLETADVVITGEGRFDSQSASGKVVGHVLDLARGHGVRCHLIAGQIDAPTDGFAAAHSLVEAAGDQAAALADAAGWLTVAAHASARAPG